MSRPLRLGMVGGGSGAFIGGVHRMAARLDGSFETVAGALSSTEQKSRESGRALGLDDRRSYGTWEQMLEGELARPEGDRIDAVSIVTPNHVHFPVASAFVRAGFNVVCDKPMVLSSAEASELSRAVREAGVTFAVTYNYSGYPLVREARELVASGALGTVRKVLVEYNQGWLATRLEEQENKQADWRTDPARSGVAGAVGDIGSHAENLVSTVTGLELTHICADLSTFVPGRRLDDDASLLLRFDGGAKGVLIASQIAVGIENGLTLRVYGEEGGLHWRQEEPNSLLVHRLGEADRVLRPGNDYLSESARAASRLPSGHPEAFLEAFANIYRGVAAAIRNGGTKDPLLDFPGVVEGSRGVHFIERTVESAASEAKWTDARFRPESAAA